MTDDRHIAPPDFDSDEDYQSWLEGKSSRTVESVDDSPPSLNEEEYARFVKGE